MNIIRTIILFLIVYQQLSSSLHLTVINNAMFYSLNLTHLLINLSNISSRDQCICQCYIISNCIIVNYNGYRQECILFSTVLQTKQLRVVTTNENANVVIFNSRNEIDLSSTISTDYTKFSNVDITIQTSTSRNNLCSIPTNPIRTYSNLLMNNYIEEMINYQASFTGTAILEFGFKTKNSAKVWHLDDVSIIDTNTSNSEMLRNGNFELGSFQYWQIACTNTNCNGTGGFIDQYNCHMGSFCYQGKCRNDYEIIRQSFDVINGHIYKLTFWIKTDRHPQQRAYVNIY